MLLVKMKQLLIWTVTFATCFLSHIYCDLNNYEGLGILQVSKSQQTEEEEISSCPEINGNYPVYLPHPTDCNKFYICDKGKRSSAACPSGLHFNTRFKVCDFPENAGCDTGHSKPPMGRIIDDDNLKMCPSTENSEHPVYIPHPSECNKFYVCDRGNPHLKTCQVGLHFNSKLNICDYPESAGCDKGHSKPPMGRIIDYNNFKMCRSTENSKHPVFIPDPTECNKFYVCDRGNPHLKACQAGLHFNPKLNICDYPESAGCDKDVFEKPNDNAIEDEDFSLCPAKNNGEPAYIPHLSDCNKFYICDNGTPHVQTCQSGLYFNAKIKTCDYPKNVDCNKDSAIAYSGFPSPFCPSVDGETPIFFRHSTNCSIFYLCGNGLAYEFVCPTKLHFSLQMNICDYEEDANCQI